MKPKRVLASLVFLACLPGALARSAPAKDYGTVEFTPAHLGGKVVRFNVILPVGYATSRRRFPVLYLLHGYTGHFDDWATKTKIIRYAKGYDEIIVMPEGENGWYVNNHADPKPEWENYLIQGLIPYVDQHYRTVAARRGRAIAGLSMGGYGALKIGLQYPQLFAAVASLSGALASARSYWFDSLTSPTVRKVIEDDFGPTDNPARTTNDPFELIREVPAGEMPQLYLSIGSSDLLLSDNREFIHLLSQLKIPYEYREVPGRHEWPVWDGQIQAVLEHQAPVIGALKSAPRD